MLAVCGGGYADDATEPIGKMALRGEAARERDLGDRQRRAGEQLSRVVDAASDYVLVRGLADGRAKRAREIQRAQVDLGRKSLEAQVLAEMLLDVVEQVSNPGAR